VTRLVIDASALLSGIVATDPSPPARLVDALFDGHFESVVCPRLVGLTGLFSIAGAGCGQKSPTAYRVVAIQELS